MIELREYQKNILKSCLEKNTLVILPTGTGKTIIAFFLIIERLRQYPDQKAFFLAPTRPLVNQHYENFKKLFPDYSNEALAIHGDINKERRRYLYKQAKIIFVTPQTLQNDIISGIVNFYDASTIVFDEAHRAVKKYSYVFIAKKFIEQSKNPRIVGLTASPGWNIDRIQEVINNLYIENVEIRTGKEKDISKYIVKIDIEPVYVDLDERIKNISDLLKKALEIRLDKLKEIYPNIEIKKGKKDVLEYIDELKKEIMLNRKDKNTRQALLLLSEMLKIVHAIELIETQTVETFLSYFKSLESNIRKTYSQRLVLSDIRIKKAIEIANSIIREGKEHPKLFVLNNLVLNNKDKKIIIFAQIRKTLDVIKKYFDKNNIKSEIFAGKKYMTQTEQIKIIDRFRKGDYNVLLATSVGEEGIDIPKVDIVIFYEPVPSEIRYIQRRGRTGRGEFGKVMILVAKDTLDERFYWVAINKERKMFRLIKRIIKYLKMSSNNYIMNSSEREKYLDDKKDKKEGISKFLYSSTDKTEENIKKEDKNEVTKIIADYKEKDSGVMQILYEMNVLLELQNLHVGDYIVGEYIIERKSFIDFINSIIDGRLYSQLNSLKEVEDKKPILILEGDEDILIDTTLHENYIKSIILKIILEYKIPIIRTKDFIETAKYIYLLSQESYLNARLPQFQKNIKSLDDVKLEILKTIPGIGENLAKKLLNRFKSLKNIFNANKVELEKIVGEVKADRIKKIYEEEYRGEYK